MRHGACMTITSQGDFCGYEENTSNGSLHFVNLRKTVVVSRDI